MPIALLLAMQAAGMIVDFIGTAEQGRYMDMGARVQQAGYEASLAQTRLETEDASLQAMKNLRRTLGSQIAVFAARGTNTGQGSALSILNESIGNANADERMRRLNLLGRENAIKSGRTIASLNEAGERSKLWQGFAQRSFNRFATNSQAYGAIGKSFGMTQMT